MNMQTESAMLFAADNKGKRVEVFSDENVHLFQGEIGPLIRKSTEVKILLRKGEEITEEAGENMHVKIIARGAEKDSEILFGVITERAATFIYVSLEGYMKYTEERLNFRLPVQKDCVVRRENGEEDLCRTVDISLRGVCIESPKDYEPEEKIQIGGLQLEPGGKTYTFSAKIVRKDEREEGKRYGCCFLGLKEKEEDALCRDIFSIERERVRQGRK